VNYDNSLVVTITVTCNLWAPSSGDHSFAGGAIYQPPQRSCSRSKWLDEVHRYMLQQWSSTVLKQRLCKSFRRYLYFCFSLCYHRFISKHISNNISLPTSSTYKSLVPVSL